MLFSNCGFKLLTFFSLFTNNTSSYVLILCLLIILVYDANTQWKIIKLCKCSYLLGAKHRRCPNSVLEGRCPAEFNSDFPQHTCCVVSRMPSKSLISCFRCVWLGLELNSAGHWPSRIEFGQPWPQYRRSLYEEYAVCAGHQLSGGTIPVAQKIKNTFVLY